MMSLERIHSLVFILGAGLKEPVELAHGVCQLP